jgi:hypothetical protein
MVKLRSVASSLLGGVIISSAVIGVLAGIEIIAIEGMNLASIAFSERVGGSNLEAMLAEELQAAELPGICVNAIYLKGDMYGGEVIATGPAEYRIVITGPDLSRGALRHEIGHIALGHCDLTLYEDKYPDQFLMDFVYEPQASLYALSKI